MDQHTKSIYHKILVYKALYELYFCFIQMVSKMFPENEVVGHDQITFRVNYTYILNLRLVQTVPRSFLSVAWPTGVQLMFFFCSVVSTLFGTQGSPSSGSLLNL